MYGRDLLEELDNVLGGSLQRVIMAAMRDEAERDAHILYKAMKGMGYDEETLLEILYVLLCTLEQTFFFDKQTIHHHQP